MRTETVEVRVPAFVRLEEPLTEEVKQPQLELREGEDVAELVEQLRQALEAANRQLRKIRELQPAEPPAN